MRKLFALLGLIATFTLVPAATIAAAPPPTAGGLVQRVPAWNLVGNYVINFDCSTCVPHNITISAYDPYTGALSGYGAYALNPAFTWSVSGTLTGDQIAMHILYTGQGAGYAVNLTGTVAANGTMSGTATDSSGATFGWYTSSGVVGSYVNHGQFVKSQDDKRMAAQSNFGKPVAK